MKSARPQPDRDEGVKGGSGGPEILVIRMGSMGDIVHALPAAASLKAGIPGARVTWAVEPRWMPLLEGNPYVDRLCLVNRRSWAGIRETFFQLRRQRFDLAVDFQGLVKSALVARIAAPSRIFGFHPSQTREKAATWLYSVKVLAAAPHVVDRNLELATAAGAARIIKEFPLPQGKPESALPEGGFVLACPLAGWPAKQWPLAHFGAIGRRLKRELGLTLVLNGPSRAEVVFSAVADVATHYSSVEGLIDATRRAVAVLGVDSGPLHLAAALGKPGVALFGPTDPARNGPYGGTIQVLRHAGAATTYKRQAVTHESMFQLHPDKVFEALSAQLSPSGERTEFSR